MTKANYALINATKNANYPAFVLSGFCYRKYNNRNAVFYNIYHLFVEHQGHGLENFSCIHFSDVFYRGIRDLFKKAPSQQPMAL